jgi:hypothetical protein
MGRKSHIDILPDGIYQEMLPFPEAIMMVGDGRNCGLRYDFRNGDAQGQVERYGQGIFRD